MQQFTARKKNKKHGEEGTARRIINQSIPSTRAPIEVAPCSYISPHGGSTHTLKVSRWWGGKVGPIRARVKGVWKRSLKDIKRVFEGFRVTSARQTYVTETLMALLTVGKYNFTKKVCSLPIKPFVMQLSIAGKTGICSDRRRSNVCLRCHREHRSVKICLRVESTLLHGARLLCQHHGQRY